MLPQEVGKGCPSAVGVGVQSAFPVTWADLWCHIVPTAQADWGARGQVEVSGRCSEVRRAGGSWNFPFSCVLLYICRCILGGEEGPLCGHASWTPRPLLSLCQHAFVPIASVAAVAELLHAFFFLLPELQELLLRVGDGGKLAHEGCWGQRCWLGLVFPH